MFQTAFLAARDTGKARQGVKNPAKVIPNYKKKFKPRKSFFFFFLRAANRSPLMLTTYLNLPSLKPSHNSRRAESRAEQGHLASLPRRCGREDICPKSVSESLRESDLSLYTQATLHSIWCQRARKGTLVDGFDTHASVFLSLNHPNQESKKPPPRNSSGVQVEYRNLPWTQSHMAPLLGSQHMCVSAGDLC